ncbi:hypothetical protein JWG42_16490 [Desulfoprunum benzoelyticum]|uniref:Uncharacterized protein n=1 Tax=Desulfoprunum benzoelyticum TaxID=1506996 RepID=A0A840V7G5_9BACT|nr:hypothetical protein [Desulfoprunum benzoelyticum]MBB5349699.1 hypothetical protein [Desulfoprunum benzoelyticum]MBM9531758.1 hypothetical protein [Desulfoprunum benzoelyticum]
MDIEVKKEDETGYAGRIFDVLYSLGGDTYGVPTNTLENGGQRRFHAIDEGVE